MPSKVYQCGFMRERGGERRRGSKKGRERREREVARAITHRAISLALVFVFLRQGLDT